MLTYLSNYIWKFYNFALSSITYYSAIFIRKI